MKQPHIAVIILHYKNLNDTKECLKSLEKINYPNYNTIVVNNDSKEDAQSLKDGFFDIQIIQNEKNLGFAEGNNVGTRAALADKKTDAILILNNDTTVEPNFLNELVKVDADMIAPRMLDYNDHDKIDNLGIVLMSSGLTFNRRQESQKLFCPTGGAALYSRKLLEVVKLGNNYFDPTYFAYAEDLDLGWRARNLGFEPSYAKDAIVYHKGSAIHGKLSDFSVYHTYRNLFWTEFTNLPTSLMLRRLLWIGTGRLFLLVYYTFKGRPLIILKSLIVGELGILKMTKKRSHVQTSINVSNKKILSWFEKGLFPKNLLK